jgi:putative transposase
MRHGVSNQPRAGTAIDENTGAGRHGARTEHQPPSSTAQDISVPAQGSGRDTTQPGIWSTDITYIRLARGFVYLVAVMDWYSRKVLSWQLSNTLDGGFCVECLEKALQTFGTPEIFNTDQGCQFTADTFTSVLKTHGIGISMDGRGRALDNVFVERLWRDVKHEDVYLKGYATVPEVQTGLTEYFVLRNSERTHQSLDYSTPDKVYRTASGGGARIVDKFKEKNVVLPQKTGQPAELQSIEARQPKRRE